MLALSEMGAIVAPPVPALYAEPQSIEDMVDHSVGRIADLFGLDTGTVRRWGESPAATKQPRRATRRQRN